MARMGGVRVRKRQYMHTYQHLGGVEEAVVEKGGDVILGNLH